MLKGPPKVEIEIVRFRKMGHDRGKSAKNKGASKKGGHKVVNQCNHGIASGAEVKEEKLVNGGPLSRRENSEKEEKASKKKKRGMRERRKR